MSTNDSDAESVLTDFANRFIHNAEYFGLGLDFDRRLPGLLERVTLDEVNETAATFLTPDRAAISVAGP